MRASLSCYQRLGEAPVVNLNLLTSLTPVSLLKIKLLGFCRKKPLLLLRTRVRQGQLSQENESVSLFFPGAKAGRSASYSRGSFQLSLPCDKITV